MLDLDRAYVALGAADIDPTFLRHLGWIVQLQETLKLSSQELISFWGTMPTAGDDALYQKLFLNKAVREIDVVFTSVDGKYLPASLDLKIKDHVPALLAGLRTRAADLSLIRKHTKLDDAAAPLTLSTATALYRYVTLARALKLAVKDLIELQAMSGETLFSALPDPLGGFTEIDPARTLRFAQLTDRVKQSGFTPVSLSYLFNNLTDVRPQLAPQNESVQLLLATIGEGLIRIAAENVSTDDPTGETTRARLGQMFESHTVEQIAGLIAGTQTYTAPLAAKPAALPVAKVTYDEAGRLLKSVGWLTVADRDALLALPESEGLSSAVKSLFEQPRDLLEQTLGRQLGWTTAETDLKASVLEATSLGADGTIEPALVAGKFKAFLTGASAYLRNALGRAFVRQTLADALNLEPAAASLLLEGAQEVVPLGTDAKKEVPSIADFLRLSGDGLKATYFENETLIEPSRESRVDPTVDFRWDAKHGFSVRWTGKLLADKTQRYQFHVRAGGSVQFTVDGKPLIDRQEDVAPAEYTIAVEMETGKLYDLELKYFNHAAPALIELRWSGPATPAEIVPSFRLYSDGDILEAVERTYIRLHKASLLLKGFNFTSREIAYLAQPKKSDGSLAHPNAFDLNDLPVDNPAPDQHALFAAWARWNDFAALRAIAMRDPTFLVLPHSFESSALEGSVTNSEAKPYILNYKSDKMISAVDQDLDRPLQAQLAQLTTAVNPWLASRAGIAVSEMRALEIPAPGGEAKSVADLSLDSKLLDHGVLQPGLVGLRRELAEFRFETFFHPYAAEFQKRMNRIDSQRPADIQHPQGLPKLTSFGDAYRPSTQVRKPWPEHKVEFELAGSYSLYNWEIFFHAPLFLATRLSENQRFEEAMRWFHFIFDPTAPASPTELAPQCYWNALPFRNAQPLRLDDMLKAMNAGNADLIAQWQDLQSHPFQPHRVARMRLIAYQKTVVMKYIDNLIAWADQLFRQDAIESINQATRLYVMAAELLGPLPQRLPQRGRNQTRTYNELRAAGFDKFNQVMTLFENDLPFSSQATAGDSSTESTGLLGIGRTFYFGILKNDKLLGYWDTVADRLFKIRHCMNIEGVVRELPLFEPPIDPALLVRAAAQGIDLSSVLNDLSAPLPLYRFSAILGKALELTAELRSLGAALLAALEKRDAEHLADLRATHETELLSLVKQVKEQQHEEAKTTEEGLQKNREVIQTRYDFYNNIPQRIAEEANQLFQLEEGRNFQRDGQTAENIITDLARDLPDMTTGWGYSTSGGWQQKADITWGRSNVIAHYQADSRRKSYDASIRVSWANDASILGGWQRRANDWELQKKLALKELAQIDKQIASAHIRVAIAQQELDNTTRQIEQSQEVEEFLRTKFTGEELYIWMQGEISTIYFQCYQMTYDLAKKAERCFRFERGLTNSNFIQFGAWDSLRKGLLSGERLYLQLKQMERAYLDGNRREYELTKHYSLALNDPQALINLKGQGQCEIELPEALFDSDYPGHYMRRVKSVSLTIPAVVGPYTSLNCTLTLLRDKTRVKATPAAGYAERDGEEDDRFMTNWAPLQSIATSTGQNDGGLFELNFRDERYLPFEGAGTISRWRITLDPDANGFDFNTLSDVVLHLRYTARDGGERLKKGAQESLAQAISEEATKPLARLFSLKHEFPTEWQRFTQPVAPAVGTFTIDKERFPFLFRGKSKTITVRKVHLYAVLKHGAEPTSPLSVVLTPPGGDENRIEFELRKSWREIQAPKNTPDVETEITATAADSKWVLKTDPGELAKNVDDLLLMCEYTVELNR